MKERLVHALNSLTAKYVAVFMLLVAVPAIGISAYLLDSSYNDNRAALIREQERGEGACRPIDQASRASRPARAPSTARREPRGTRRNRSGRSTAGCLPAASWPST